MPGSKHFTIFLMILVLFWGCTSKEPQSEKSIEDGVEVIINPGEPDSQRAQSLSLDKEFSISTEHEDIIKRGLMDLWGFDVDSHGNIYVFNRPSSRENLIAKFDTNGNFLSSFGKRGQGPNEFRFPTFHKLTHRHEIPLLDGPRNKFFLLDGTGNHIKEMDLKINLRHSASMALPLRNGGYLIRRIELNPEEGITQIVLGLFSPEFEEIRELDRITLNDPLRAEKIPLPVPSFVWGISKDRIFIGSQGEKYEILVYDFEGNLKRKIKKKCRLVEISEEYKNDMLTLIRKEAPQFEKKLLFSKYFPAVQFCFADDGGRLYVMTFERGENPEEYIFDVFDKEGFLIARKGLQLLLTGGIYRQSSPLDSWATAKNGRLYCLSEKKSGHKELTVYKMRWE